MADETSDFTSSLLLTFLCSKYLTYGGDSLIPGLKKKPILQFLNAQFPHHLICYILGSNERITRYQDVGHSDRKLLPILLHFLSTSLISMLSDCQILIDQMIVDGNQVAHNADVS